jgi:tetratricopeptide (TPR) repeat protein
MDWIQAHIKPILGNNAKIIVCLILVCAISSMYWQVIRFEFTSFDDDLYVTANRVVQSGLTEESVRWAFIFADKPKTYWHPLTWLSHMLDVELYGMNPGGHHFTNVLLHIASSLLLFGLFHQMTGELWRSSLIAALFGLHPINVESVAWVAERKNVLSTFFWMLTILTYARYSKRSNLARYLLVVLVFACGLLAKPMLVTLPFVLLLLDYWPLKRFSFEDDPPGRLLRLILEKTPLLILSLFSVYLSSRSVQGLGIVKSIESLPLTLRIENALVSYVKYIFKMIWPVNLAVYYPYPSSIPLWQGAGALVILSAITVAVFLLARRRRYLVVGWFWYLGTLVPVTGLVQVGLWPAMADRWAYLPLIGLFVMITWGVSAFKYMRFEILILSTLLLFLFFQTALVQIQYWKNNIELYLHSIQVTSRNYVAHNNLGVALMNQNNIEKAIFHYEKAIRIKPNFADAYYNMGVSLEKVNRRHESVKFYDTTLKLNPNHINAHNNLGNVFLQQGKIDKAIRHYMTALKFAPNDPEIHNNLGVALMNHVKAEQAVDHFRKAVQIDPNYFAAKQNLEKALKRTMDAK